MLNSSSPLELLMGNTSTTLTGGAVAFPKDSFSNALTKNIVAMLVWLTLSVINSSMVHTFLQHSFFYEDPRYIMFIYMVINDALQLSLVTALYVVSYIFRQIHASICCLLIMTAVLTTRSTPLILAGMALERYISICFPLHYGQICTIPRTLLLIGIILILTAAPPITDLLITVVKEPPHFFHSSIFCDHSLLFRDRSIYYKNCVFDVTYFSFVALTLLYTYCKIMLTARAASMGLVSVKKARNTVLLHGVQLLLCMLAFVVPSLQAALISLFPYLSLEIRYIFFLLVYIIPRFLSPMIYGFRDEKFRKYWARYLVCWSSGTTRLTCDMNSLGRLDDLKDTLAKNIITFSICMIINFINGTFVYTYFKNQVFQREPRYILYIHLVISDMIVLTLSVMLQFLTYTTSLNLTSCCIFLVILITTNKNSPLNLADMAMERYVAVCHPLHHIQICTMQRAYALTAVIWIVSFLPALTDVLIILATQPLMVFSRSVICHSAYVYNTVYHKAQRVVIEVKY
ncbi:hypothetical protein LDENG_00036800 [Lucifuga dentata]|nr:hypothetical protein LDENG_00036800 [Lucifuga dentata]